MGEAAELSSQLSGLEPMEMNVPGIDNRQMPMNIMHCLSRQLEPQTTYVTGIDICRVLRRRSIPRLFFFGARVPRPPSCVGGGW
jgi:hypothetical protein